MLENDLALDLMEKTDVVRELSPRPTPLSAAWVPQELASCPQQQRQRPILPGPTLYLHSGHQPWSLQVFACFFPSSPNFSIFLSPPHHNLRLKRKIAFVLMPNSHITLLPLHLELLSRFLHTTRSISMSTPGALTLYRRGG